MARESLFVVNVFVNENIDLKWRTTGNDALTDSIYEKEIERLIRCLTESGALPENRDNSRVRVYLHKDTVGDIGENQILAQIARNGVYLGDRNLSYPSIES